MITSELPVATAVQLANLEPTKAAGLPFMMTEELPVTIGAVCVPHLRPAGIRWGTEVSPILAAPLPFITTSVLPVAIT